MAAAQRKRSVNASCFCYCCSFVSSLPTLPKAHSSNLLLPCTHLHSLTHTSSLTCTLAMCPTFKCQLHNCILLTVVLIPGSHTPLLHSCSPAPVSAPCHSPPHSFLLPNKLPLAYSSILPPSTHRCAFFHTFLSTLKHTHSLAHTLTLCVFSVDPYLDHKTCTRVPKQHTPGYLHWSTPPMMSAHHTDLPVYVPWQTPPSLLWDFLLPLKDGLLPAASPPPFPAPCPS